VRAVGVAVGLFHWLTGASDGTSSSVPAWTAAQAPLLPGATAAKEQYVNFGSVTCPAAGNCIAVGAYTEKGGSMWPVIETAAS
jgi:hypothetical protein